MKKIISIILLFTLVFSVVMFTSCNIDLEKSLITYMENHYILDTPLRKILLADVYNNRVEILMVGEDKSLNREFFGKNIIKNIELVSYVNRVPQNPANKNEGVGYIRCTKYTVQLWQNNKLNLLYAIQQLSKLPGVFTVDVCTYNGVLEITANDTYYTNDLAWGLKKINVEKVWDFGKYK